MGTPHLKFSVSMLRVQVGALQQIVVTDDGVLLAKLNLKGRTETSDQSLLQCRCVHHKPLL
jgi:hypothetical protein